MRRLLIALLFFVLLFPHATRASGADLGFKNKSDIFFSTDTLVVGDTVRVYASVHNFGDVDVAGYVGFMQGMVEIGNTQVISVRAGGQEEEVYVDFVVPEGEFNIRAEIRGTDPADTNTSNDIVLSGLVEPIEDSDGDGIEDDADNCPENSNANQKNSDNDLAGDACDADDDNDTLTDTVEKEMGTSSASKDSDGDGVDDAADYAPTDATVSSEPVAPVVPAAPIAAAAAPAIEPITTTSTTSEQTTDDTQDQTSESIVNTETTASNDDSTTSNGAALSDLQVSPKAIFTYEQSDWNSQTFSVLGPISDDETYAWDFGDGVTSNRPEVTHTYRTFGDYAVQLTVTNADGVKSTDSTSISISFFHIQNPYLQILLAILGVLCATSVALYLRVARRAV